MFRGIARTGSLRSFLTVKSVFTEAWRNCGSATQSVFGRRTSSLWARTFLRASLSVNVLRIEHLPATEHREFYNSQSFTLNLTRADMRKAGYSPSVRLFEAAACGVAIMSDDWPCLSEVFTPGTEILLVRNVEDVAS